MQEMQVGPLSPEDPLERKWQPTPALQCSRLENPMDRGAWRATVPGPQSQTRLSDCAGPYIVGQHQGRMAKHAAPQLAPVSLFSVSVPVLSSDRLCSPMDCSPPGPSVHGDSPGMNTGIGCHAPLPGSSLPGIKPTSLTSPALVGVFFTTCHLSSEKFKSLLTTFSLKF